MPVPWPVDGFALARNEKQKNAFEKVSDYRPKEIGILGADFRKKDHTDIAILKTRGL